MGTDTETHDNRTVITQRFNDREALADTLARDIAARLRLGLEQRERVSLVVSGGSTPVPLFRRLRTQSLPWTRVDVTLADERWVDAGHPDSNEALVRRELLQDNAAAATLVPLKSPEDTPEAAAAHCEARLNALSRPFEVVVLGMGKDGHFASLFPDTAALKSGLNMDAHALCVPCHPDLAPHPRMSLTLPALLNARHVILHITGEDKLGVLEQALDAPSAPEVPISALLHQKRVPIHVYWAS